MMKSIYTLLLSLSFCTGLFAGTFIVQLTIPCNQPYYAGPLGFPTWNPAKIIKAPVNGAAQIIGKPLSFDTLLYMPFFNFQGTDTVIVECAHATQITCDTGIYILNVSCSTGTKAPAYSQYKLKISPNPVVKFMTIESNFELNELAVVSLEGELIARWNEPGSRQWAKVDLTGLPPGYYGLMAILDEEQWVMELFYKQ